MSNKPQGIGPIGSFFTSTKCRWTFSADFPSEKLPETFVKVSPNPSISPATQKQQITTTFCDFEETKPLWALFQSTVNVDSTGNIGLIEEGTIVLTMYSGIGNKLEQYRLLKCIPLYVNFGELYYGSSDDCSVEVTWQYETCELILPESDKIDVAIKDANIYGFETPERHFIKFSDGEEPKA